MNRKYFYGFAVLVIAVAAAFNANFNSKGVGLSDMSLANVEALAGGDVSVGPICMIGPDDFCIYPPEFPCCPYWDIIYPGIMYN